MNEITVFTYNETPIRTVQKDGEPWWVLKDVCDVLEIANSRDAASRLDDDEKDDVGLTDAIGREQNTTVISEPGLYAVILQSRKPEAKEFKRWITHEILPQIRQTGGYLPVVTEESDEDFLARALQVAARTLEAREKRLREMQPKAEYFDALVDRNLLTSFRDTAKELGVKPQEFIDFLSDRQYIYRDAKGKWMPYSSNEQGLFEVKEWVSRSNGSTGLQTLITPKGRETFRLLLIDPL